MKFTVYLAGKITGDPAYYAKFTLAERALRSEGYRVISPAVLLPDGFTYDAYMRMTTAMLDECESVCFLSDWKDSEGATYEYGRAVAKNKTVFLFDEWEETRLAPKKYKSQGL